LPTGDATILYSYDILPSFAAGRAAGSAVSPVSVKTSRIGAILPERYTST
jgi:hypothetical protein